MLAISSTSDPGPSEPAGSRAVTRCSRIDLLRMIAADTIARLEAATPSERMALVLQLRSQQDQISVLKHRLPLLASRPSNLAWVDTWTPPQ